MRDRQSEREGEDEGEGSGGRERGRKRKREGWGVGEREDVCKRGAEKEQRREKYPDKGNTGEGTAREFSDVDGDAVRRANTLDFVSRPHGQIVLPRKPSRVPVCISTRGDVNYGGKHQYRETKEGRWIEGGMATKSERETNSEKRDEKRR
eukprot:2596987-Rhodomonas_salina.1